MKVTLPLVGGYNTRGVLDADISKDRRLSACIVIPVLDNLQNEITPYVQKRPGWTSYLTPGQRGKAILLSEKFNQLVFSTDDVAGAGTGSTIWVGGTDVGTADSAHIRELSEVELGNVQMILMTDAQSTIGATDGSGWYLPSDAYAVTAYTADGNNSTTITDIKIAGVNSTAGLYSGQLLAAASNIVAGSRVVSVDSGAFTAVLDTATTGGAFNDLAITKTPIAKITNANFPSTIRGRFVEDNGYAYIMDATNARIYNSALNDITTWTASGYIPCNYDVDGGYGLAKYKKYIVGFGKKTIEFFQFAGNATGSPLSVVGNATIKLGAQGSYNGATNIATAQDAIFFASGGYGTNNAIYMLDQFQPVRISTPTIENILSENLINQFDAFVGFGQTILNVGVASGPRLFYSVETKQWTESGFSDDYRITGGYTVGVSASIGEIYGISMTTAGAGEVFRMRPTAPTFVDDGVAYTMTIQGANNNLGTGGWKQIQSFELIADTQASGTTLLEITNDDYATWQTIGTFDMTAQRKIIECGGGYYGEIAFRVTHSANTEWRGQGLIVEYF